MSNDKTTNENENNNNFANFEFIIQFKMIASLGIGFA